MTKRNVILGVIALLILAGVAYVWLAKPTLPWTSPSGGEKNPPVTEKNEPKLDFTPAYKEANVPLSQVPNYQAVKTAYGLQLSAKEEKFLDQNKFLLVDLSKTSFKPGVNFDQMLYDFDSMSGGAIYDRKPENTKLVTPDIVLHAYHKFFELTLEELEQNELSKTLNDFLVGLNYNLAAAVRANAGMVKERYQNLAGQMVLARVLFENKNTAKPDYFQTPEAEAAYLEKDKTIDTAANAKTILNKYAAELTPDMVSAIQAEIDKIYAANEVAKSPLFSQYSDELKTDYTQYTPRSHYTKNSALRAYFRTMMYLGRSSYFLKKDIGIIDTNLLTIQFNVKSSAGKSPLDAWKKIMAITGFYAGQSDDLTYNEWRDYETKILGANLNPDSDLATPASIAKLAGNLNQLRLPKILSDVVVSEDIFSQTKADLLRNSLAYRVFGQRFTFDAWVLNDLTAGQEKTDVRLPSTPSALFVSAAMGDLKAKEHVQEFLKRDAGFSGSEVTGFLTKLGQKKSDIAKVKKDEWFASMGSAWLYVLGSLTHNFGDKYPLYMQAVSFLDKQIQTFLGSYAELKHDTLLYAKQSYAELGGGPADQNIPPVVKGFVEPNIEFWNKFNELLSRTRDFFVKNDLLIDSTALARLNDFMAISAFYGEFAKQELQGVTISDGDYEKLRNTKLSFMAQPFSGESPDETSGQVALIADIHTDALKGQILYEATGQPYLMLVVVANEASPRVVASLVFNHYELTNPLAKRLTDEDWRALVYKQVNKLPIKNFWYQSLLAK